MEAFWLALPQFRWSLRCYAAYACVPPGLVPVPFVVLFSSEKMLAFSRLFNSLKVTVYVAYRAL
jgi:hypothetical protein